MEAVLPVVAGAIARGLGAAQRGDGWDTSTTSSALSKAGTFIYERTPSLTVVVGTACAAAAVAAVTTMGGS